MPSLRGATNATWQSRGSPRLLRHGIPRNDKEGAVTQLFGYVALCMFLALGNASAAEQAPKRGGDARLVQIEDVEVRSSLVGPVVLLKVQGKAIPIFVDAIVAQSILGALSGDKFARPLSHDLMRTILEGFDA